MSTTIVILSDTHDQLNKLSVPEGDVLIHCGDFCRAGTADEVARFNSEFANLPHQYKILVAGNHDVPFIGQAKVMARNMLDHRIIYLEDDAVEIAGLKFYGSPWRSRMMETQQPPFFKLRSSVLNWLGRSDRPEEVWNKIPDETDVLITHGPPYGILDETPNSQHVGCELLRKRIDKLRPRLHCFGHIHHSYGYMQTPSTLFVNAANVDENYNPANAPVLVTIDDAGVRIVS